MERKQQTSPTDEEIWLSARVKPEGKSQRVGPAIAGKPTENPMFESGLMEKICDRANLQVALRRVVQNGGATS